MPKLNSTIFYLLWSEVFVGTGFGLIEPILAIYVHDQIPGGSVATVGISMFLFLLIKSLIQLPLSLYTDKRKHHTFLLLLGAVFITFTPLLYIAAKSVLMVYLAQIFYGIGSGLSYPSWLGLWSTHLDKNRESFQWTLYSTLVGVSAALAAAIGGTLAEFVGFQTTFLLSGAFALLGSLFLLRLEIKTERGHRKNHDTGIEL